MKKQISKKTILLIEDDNFLAEIYTQKIKKENFEVLIAHNLEEATKIFQETIPDLILLDIILPGLNGWSLLKDIKNESRFAKTKIIILSNLSQKTEIEKGLNLGADLYLIKSQYTPAEVVQEIKKLLKC